MHERPKILVVDDVPEDVEVLAKNLAQGYDIQCAFSGAEALELATDQPDLILLDAMMSGMDGFEVCARLKANAATAAIPVIFITARSCPEDETAAFEAGAMDFITKPVNWVTARARIKTHLTLKLQNDLLRSQVSIDGLTGISNRRCFDERLLTEWRHVKRHQQFLAILMIDIDYFKPYNDLCGHLAGDFCLRQVAGILKAGMLRAHDLAARYGGEEFVCLLPECNLAGAVTKADALRAAVEGLAIPHAASAVSEFLTISVGVAVTRPEASLSADRLVATAEAMLCRAKEEGRNRVLGTSQLVLADKELPQARQTSPPCWEEPRRGM